MVNFYLLFHASHGIVLFKNLQSRYIRKQHIQSQSLLDLMPSVVQHLLFFNLLPLLVLPATAFKLSFHENENSCTGEFLGTWVGGPAQGCRTDFV